MSKSRISSLHTGPPDSHRLTYFLRLAPLDPSSFFPISSDIVGIRSSASHLWSGLPAGTAAPLLRKRPGSSWYGNRKNKSHLLLVKGRAVSQMNAAERGVCPIGCRPSCPRQTYTHAPINLRLKAPTLQCASRSLHSMAMMPRWQNRRTADDISDSMVIKYVQCLSFYRFLARPLLTRVWMGYSHISPFLFTKTLVPVLENTALQPGSDVRIVNVCAVPYLRVAERLNKHITAGGFGCAPMGAESAI